MKKLIIFGLIALLLTSFVSASVEEAKQEWFDAVAYHEETKTEWKEAQDLVNADPSDENVENVIEKAKISLTAGLDAAIEYFEYLKEVAEEEDIESKDTILADLDKNIEKAEVLKLEVDAIQSRWDVGIAVLDIFGKYLEFLSDVMRNTGYVYVEKMDLRIDKIETHRDLLEIKVEAVEDEENKEKYLEMLAEVDEEIEQAKANVEEAQAEYDQISQPTGSGQLFASGNNEIRQAHANLVQAHAEMVELVLEMRGDQL